MDTYFLPSKVLIYFAYVCADIAISLLRGIRRYALENQMSPRQIVINKRDQRFATRTEILSSAAIAMVPLV